MVNIKKNENYTLNITGMTHEGQGVGRVNDFTVFVDRAIIGETVEVKIIKINKSYAVGKLINIIKPSSNRTEPFCPAFKRCGGCSLQHMTYKAQLEFKTNTVKDNIKRIGKLDDVVVHDTIGMNDESGLEGRKYRNKAQYPVGATQSGISVGFYAARSHDIIDNDTCDIQSGISDKIRSLVKGFIEKNNISVYDEAEGKGLVRHIMTRVGYRSKEVMVVLAINGRDLQRKQELIDLLVENVPEIKSIYLNVNTQKTNIILGTQNIKIYGKDTITDYIGEFKFEISPLSFFQVNPVQTEVLYGKALEYAGLTGNEVVFDLYCGIGTISLFLSQKAKKVYGVEIIEDAILNARANAKLNAVDNVEFIVGEAERVMPDIYQKGVKADVVVVDPPRKGCDEVLLKTLVEMQPERIVYVSCNPSTLARDLKYLDGNGYIATEVQPVDMFPQTEHVEAVILLQNLKR